MNGSRESLFTLLLLIGVFAELTHCYNVVQIKAELARGGRHVCPHCWACAHSWNCNRPCRPNYRDLCPLCAYRFHCSSTCVNVCPFPETTPAPTTPPTTTPEPTTPPPTTPDDVCRPNPCPFDGTCQRESTAPGGYVCTGDERCEGLSGRCQTDSISCLGGYISSLCSGANDRKCCLPDPGDTECSDLNGFCQDSSASCPGEYRSGLCAGSSNRQCCLPKEMTTTPVPTTPPATTPDPETSFTPQTTTTPAPKTPPTITPAPTTPPPTTPDPETFLTPQTTTTPAPTTPPRITPVPTTPPPTTSDPETYLTPQTTTTPAPTTPPTTTPKPTTTTGGSCLASSEMKALQNKLIEYEGLKYKAYDAQPKNKKVIDWTICVGFNLKRKEARNVFSKILPGVRFDAVYNGTKSLTKAQCLALFESDLTKTYIPRAKKAAGNKFCGFPQNVKIALVSAVYRGDLAYKHNTAKLIRAGKWCSVRAEYLDNNQYKNCVKLGIPGVCTRMNWNADQFQSMC